MSRFFVSKESVRGNTIEISGDEAHHILDVMRLRKLDKIVAFDGTGREYKGFIKDVKKNSLLVEIVQTRTPAGIEKSRITLLQALPKKDKMDYIIEKSTELGAYSIIPLITERTIPKWNDSKRRSHEDRWKKIATQAAKQCGRTDVPMIGNIVNFSDSLKGASCYDLALIALLSDDTVNFWEALSGFRGGRIAMAIGPEGDFTPQEARLAARAGFKAVSLGPRILKSDTAGLASLAILNYELSKH
jgi:16S rRNA (uracil1498-N3)-methyltransferase